MEIETSFVSWLIANGANFPKLQWPSYDNHNTRGVVAIDDIKTDEVILEIPSKLLMCEANFHQNPLIGQLIINHAEILPGDLSLCIFIMNEIKMGEASFYYPYLQILPKESNSILEWTTAELDMLQVCNSNGIISGFKHALF